MDEIYVKTLNNLKSDIQKTQNSIVLSANEKMIKLYYRIGKVINEANYGTSFAENLAQDLKLSFPNIKGFSQRNLYYIKKLNYEYDEDFVNDILTKICWSNNQILMKKVKDV